MATGRLFAYNPTHTVVSGAEIVGDLSIQTGTITDYSTLTWYMGPDEDTWTWFFAKDYAPETRPQFWAPKLPNESSLLDLMTRNFKGVWPDAISAVTWLEDNNYWVGFIVGTTSTSTTTQGPTTTSTSTSTSTTSTSTSTSTTTQGPTSTTSTSTTTAAGTTSTSTSTTTQGPTTTSTSTSTSTTTQGPTTTSTSTSSTSTSTTTSAAAISYPAYMGNGGMSALQDDYVDVAFPSTINANDILIIFAADADDDTFLAVTDFTWIDGDSADPNVSIGYWWKRATGSESGTVRVTSTNIAGNGIYGCMYRFSGCTTSGTPFEDPTIEAVTQTVQPLVPQVTSGGVGRLAVNFLGVEDDTSVTGATTYTQIASDIDLTGTDFGFWVYAQEIPSSGNVDQMYLGVNPQEYCGSLTLLLIPA